jgi:hypothetical protein
VNCLDCVRFMSAPSERESHSTLQRLVYLTRTVPRLGLQEIAYVAWYRASLKGGIRKKSFPAGAAYPGPFLPSSPPVRAPLHDATAITSLVSKAEQIHSGVFTLFSFHELPLGLCPDWHKNPFSGYSWGKNASIHWTACHEFHSGAGDVKGVWELSRFDWSLVLARAYVQTGDPRHLTLLNTLVESWVQANPVNRGVNWRCGQEASIRMLQLLLSHLIITRFSREASESDPRLEETPPTALIRFVTEHCSRIAPNIRYAVAQNNNHATSEAAALFLGGAWLAHHAKDPNAVELARRWRRIGRRWLENRVARLIDPDGSFSQRSVNYHRVMLDTLSLVETVRRMFGERRFSAAMYRKLRSATEWLFELTEPGSGRTPLLGANDGAYLFRLTEGEYRDVRPSVQWASLLFRDRAAYGEGPWNDQLRWFDLEPLKLDSSGAPSRSSRVCADGGYITCARGAHWALLHAPRFRFRPSQCDILHFDLWNGGDNLLRDSGSYSYNCEDALQARFSGPEGHNTVQFDGDPQMPGISRFLYGEWPKVAMFGDPREGRFGAEYTDFRGRTHHREVTFSNGVWTIVDTLRGYRRHAVLRWHLLNGAWERTPRGVRLGAYEIDVDSDTEAQIELETRMESQHYLHFTEGPLLTVTVRDRAARIVTRVTCGE